MNADFGDKKSPPERALSSAGITQIHSMNGHHG